MTSHKQTISCEIAIKEAWVTVAMASKLEMLIVENAT